MTKQLINDRLLKYITITDSGCWEWQGHLAQNGYGVIKVDGKTQSVHRVAYRLWVGEIPKGHQVCHSCDNRKCINPDHLFTGTPRDNMQDALAKGRMVMPRQVGSDNPRSKLTEEQVLAIREAYAQGQRVTHIAKRLGLGITTVHKIVNRQSWSHV